ncbi:uncharacterized protein B0I36DRAFT_372604 [Microdochium trichocladiopsis]|uniref:UBX domain-containing protein n=1 Tax=Microdochium trichocladiopsis TaxID=1682393 RepID=A0A9P9BSF9_9PEZI|nr:uncharacterized protein B0I36DRAFT_372604 [Microdochium trichocladiopsis]KAH7034740.1 hypothetical protein B0I36DRAFT_372604 [Microdochium trichocladiopsis]
MDEEVGQFMNITGANEQVARGYLELSNNDSAQAIQLFFEDPSLAANFNQTSSTSAAASTGGSRPSRRPTAGYAGRQDERGVIHIDSDDDINMGEDDDDDFGIPDDDDDDDDDNVAAVAQRAQEEEDAAMARRLQEEMYGQNAGGGGGPEDVRAPIAQRTEILAAPDPNWGLEDDRESAILEQLRRRQMARPRGSANPNPFSRSVWDDSSAPPVPTSTRPDTPQQTQSRAQRLADLFRPPYDLMSHLPWDQARDEGKDEKKWLLVNLQDMSDFMCQALNRDLWKDERIISLVKEHFIFLQYDKNDPQADSYLTFYFPNQSHENADNYPHVSIVDPRTGEQVKVWSGRPFPSTAEFHADLVEFLDRYSLAANSKNPVAKTKPKSKPVDYGRMTEEEMLEMALKNSLEANGSGSGASVEDPDSLTKSSQSTGKGKEVATPVDLTGDGVGPEATSSQPPAEEAAFAAISSANPHTEPENAPPQTTRIQFRHPSGRIIRRFNVTDEVRRIYEWLKAEPLDGKEGVVFELKAMPAGRDLITELDKTIDEAGLKQGTVMIEFIED